MSQEKQKCVVLAVLLTAFGIFWIWNDIGYSWRNAFVHIYPDHHVYTRSSKKPTLDNPRREKHLLPSEVGIIGWKELPVLKDDGVIPSTKEIYKVLRKIR